MSEPLSTTKVEAFEALANCEEGELRGLIREGKPAEKVWAAWQLALVAGREADATLSDALSDEPSPGVRAHWVIVLFSHGESELVAVLAEHDPSVLVRETAARYLAPTAGRAESFPIHPALAACLGDTAPRVRQTVVRHLAEEPGEELFSRVLRLSGDGDAQVRMAALEYVLGRHATERTHIAPYSADPDVHVRRRAVEALVAIEADGKGWAIERLLIEEDEQVRSHLVSAVLDAQMGAELAVRLAEKAPLMIHDVYAPLARKEERFPWSTLAPLMGACPDSPTLLVLCACLDPSTISEGAAVALIDEATAYYEGEELWLPHLIQITAPLLNTLSLERRAGFPALRALLVEELQAARAQRWGPIDKLESLLQLLEE